MSVVVGVQDPNRETVYMAADSAIVGASVVLHMDLPKLRHVGGWLFGICGDWHVMEALVSAQMAIHCNAFEPDVMGTAYDYLVNKLVPTLKKQLAATGYKCDEESHAENCMCTDMLIAYGGELFMVQPQFSVFSTFDPYMSIGSGELYGLGALHVLDTYVALASDRASAAVEAAIKYSPTCAGPIIIERTRNYHERERQPNG